jgi:hypothetical protein
LLISAGSSCIGNLACTAKVMAAIISVPQFCWVTSMRFFDSLLLLGLLYLAILLIRLDIQEARQLHAYRSTQRSAFDIPESFQFIEGRDENGAFISALPSRFQRTVFFVIHGSRFDDDVNFWNTARAENINLINVGFVGVCDRPECSVRLMSDKAKIHFISLNCGDYLAMKALLRADTQGQVVVLELPSGKLYKSASPKSPKELSALQLALAK